MARPKRYVTMADIEARSIPEPNSGCWLWLLSLDSSGYGRVVHSLPARRFEHAHRAALRLSGAEIPAGFEVHHKCRQKSCVNPAHLEALSYLDHRAADFPNGTKNQNTDKTHCLRGHALAGDNLIVEKSHRAKSGFVRRCRLCQNQRRRNNEVALGH